MPYLLLSTQIRLENGPTVCGDSSADPEAMKLAEAVLTQQLGNNFAEYRSQLTPREVLDRLEPLGYRVVGMCGVGQTACWTLYKEAKSEEKQGQNGL